MNTDPIPDPYWRKDYNELREPILYLKKPENVPDEHTRKYRGFLLLHQTNSVYNIQTLPLDDQIKWLTLFDNSFKGFNFGKIRTIKYKEYIGECLLFLLFDKNERSVFPKLCMQQFLRKVIKENPPVRLFGMEERSEFPPIPKVEGASFTCNSLLITRRAPLDNVLNMIEKFIDTEVCCPLDRGYLKLMNLNRDSNGMPHFKLINWALRILHILVHATKMTLKNIEKCKKEKVPKEEPVARTRVLSDAENIHLTCVFKIWVDFLINHDILIFDFEAKEDNGWFLFKQTYKTLKGFSSIVQELFKIIGMSFNLETDKLTLKDVDEVEEWKFLRLEALSSSDSFQIALGPEQGVDTNRDLTYFAVDFCGNQNYYVDPGFVVAVKDPIHAFYEYETNEDYKIWRYVYLYKMELKQFEKMFTKAYKKALSNIPREITGKPFSKKYDFSHVKPKQMAWYFSELTENFNPLDIPLIISISVIFNLNRRGSELHTNLVMNTMNELVRIMTEWYGYKTLESDNTKPIQYLPHINGLVLLLSTLPISFTLLPVNPNKCMIALFRNELSGQEEDKLYRVLEKMERLIKDNQWITDKCLLCLSHDTKWTIGRDFYVADEDLNDNVRGFLQTEFERIYKINVSMLGQHNNRHMQFLRMSFSAARLREAGITRPLCAITTLEIRFSLSTYPFLAIVNFPTYLQWFHVRNWIFKQFVSPNPICNQIGVEIITKYTFDSKFFFRRFGETVCFDQPTSNTNPELLWMKTLEEIGVSPTCIIEPFFSIDPSICTYEIE